MRLYRKRERKERRKKELYNRGTPPAWPQSASLHILCATMQQTPEKFTLQSPRRSQTFSGSDNGGRRSRRAGTTMRSLQNAGHRDFSLPTYTYIYIYKVAPTNVHASHPPRSPGWRALNASRASNEQLSSFRETPDARVFANSNRANKWRIKRGIEIEVQQSRNFVDRTIGPSTIDNRKNKNDEGG